MSLTDLLKSNYKHAKNTKNQPKNFSIGNSVNIPLATMNKQHEIHVEIVAKTNPNLCLL
jgi:hypothetical protein